MKGMKGQVVPVEKLKWPLIAQRKFDGVRLLTTIRNNKVTFTTYNGKVIPLPHIAAQLSSLPNCMIDGEIVLKDGSMKYRSKVSGMLNSARQGGRISERELNLHLFDSMPLSQWDAKKCNILYTERYRDTVLLTLQAGPQIHHTVNEIVYSSKDVDEKLAQLWSAGFEGLMLKEYNHRYTFTKSRLWAKCKQTKTADLLCIGTTEGTGWAEGMIGAILCVGKVEGKDVTVKVGSGFKQHERSSDVYTGKTIEVKYNSVTRDTMTGQWSLFSPRYSCVRIDK